MHNSHYHHEKEFKYKFKEWSDKSKKLMSNYTDEQLEEFKIKLRKLNDKYYIVK